MWDVEGNLPLRNPGYTPMKWGQRMAKWRARTVRTLSEKITCTGSLSLTCVRLILSHYIALSTPHSPWLPHFFILAQNLYLFFHKSFPLYRLSLLASGLTPWTWLPRASHGPMRLALLCMQTSCRTCHAWSVELRYFRRSSFTFKVTVCQYCKPFEMHFRTVVQHFWQDFNWDLVKWCTTVQKLQLDRPHFLLYAGLIVVTSILHRFRYITTFTVYVTDYLENSFSFPRQLKLQATSAFRFLCKHIAVNASYISPGIGANSFKQQKWPWDHLRCYWCHSICHIYYFPSVCHGSYVSIVDITDKPG